MSAPWPNLFVVGAAKAGTTSLWRYLGEHPDIFMTYFKEPHFFSRHRPTWFPVVHDEEAYRRLFERARAPLRGEASPSYFWSEEAATRIKAASPDAKIVISLRDPVERSYSVYCHRARLGWERRSFAACVADELDPAFDGRSDYVWHLRYAEHVTRYLRLFGPSVHVVIFEELVRDVARELAGLFAFLGVDSTVADRVRPEAHNPFTVPRNPLAARLISSSGARRIGRALVPYTLRLPIERRLQKAQSKPALDPEADRLLTDFFAPDVRELTVLLGRSLPWPRWPEAMSEVAAERSRSTATRVAH